MSKYNSDITAQNDVDLWLSKTFVDVYNIETLYRFDRNLIDINKDVSPVYLDRVEPMMTAVLSTFLEPYEKIAGKTFIKQYTPKQFVLLGSPSYNDNGSITLGTADNGRRVVLYEINSLNFSSPAAIKRPIRTIHHEFTHILNQNIVIPPSFEQVSKSDYTADWTGAANTAAVAKSLGFISQYARSSFGEDFAEMVAHLLVEGQVYFDNYCATTNAAAAADLRAKERLVYSYFKDFYNIDFKLLQNEVQSVLKTKYNATDPVDVTTTFPMMLANNKIASITYNPSAAHYATYGQSADFRAVYENFRVAMAASSWVVRNVQFLFASSTKMTFRVEFTQGTGTTVYYGDYDFNMAINNTNGLTTWTKSIPEGAGTTYSNGAIASILVNFERFFLPYLTNRQFVASYLPTGITSTDPLYRTFGGFSVNGAAGNYFYGPIVLK
ncbi:substrate import-associated zinc metallohydrolase lipoprotein [Sphingobacterium hungaricum]|uniref:substrate import-associated zinc metallohydrolase lipoprotein n=1 Tax=Sphingobacterium hungaricum TaxID=2082723 RepID=UPI0018C92C8C|nr:substrate import-associated zinc metallohydrolase lipoprotein [Sphingobacterium hungaricum]